MEEKMEEKMKKTIQVSLLMFFLVVMATGLKAKSKKYELKVKNESGKLLQVTTEAEGKSKKYSIAPKKEVVVKATVQFETKRFYDPRKNLFKKIAKVKRGSQEVIVQWSCGDKKWYWASVPAYCDFSIIRKPRCTKKVIIKGGGKYKYKYRTLLKGTAIRKTKTSKEMQAKPV
jgi:hypothetical protein